MDSKYVEFRPISSIVDTNVIDFSINGNSEDYIALADTLLCVTAKITKSDGTALTAAEAAKVAPCQYFLNGLFSQVDVSLGDRLVSGGSNTYPYVAFLESCLTFKPLVKRTQLSTSLWVEEDDVNENFKKRAAYTPKTIQLRGRLHVDFFRTSRLLINNVDLNIRLSRSKDTFCLDTTEDCDFEPKVKIIECSLQIKKVKPSPSVFTHHQQQLQSTNAKYPYRRVVTKVVSIPTGNQSIHSDNLFLGQLPVRIVIGFVKHASFNGSYKTSAFEFPNLGLNYLSLNLNGIQIPATPLTPDFANDQYMDAYMTLFQGLGISWKNTSHGITAAKYKDNLALYVFDLTADECVNSSDHVNLINTGVLRLEAKFANALAANITMICYGEMEQVIELDSSRNVIAEQ